MRRCLSNNSTLRPDAAELYTQLLEVKGHLPVTAETRIELVQQLQSSQDEIVAVRKALEEQKREVEALKREKLEEARLMEEIETLRRQLLNVPLGSFAESAVSTSHKTDEVSCCQTRQGTTLCMLQWN